MLKSTGNPILSCIIARLATRNMERVRLWTKRSLPVRPLCLAGAHPPYTPGCTTTPTPPKCTPNYHHDTLAGVRVYTTTTKTNNNIPPTKSTTSTELLWKPTPKPFSFIWLPFFSCWPYFKRASQSFAVDWKTTTSVVTGGHQVAREFLPQLLFARDRHLPGQPPRWKR